MLAYRIVTDDNHIWVQCNKGILGWRDVRSGWSGYRWTFGTIDEAREFVARRQQYEKNDQRGFRVVEQF